MSAIRRYWDRVANGPVAPKYVELERWREGLTTFDRRGAYRSRQYNLSSGGSEIRTRKS